MGVVGVSHVCQSIVCLKALLPHMPSPVVYVVTASRSYVSLCTNSNPTRATAMQIMGVPCWREREVESGQIVVNKRLAWKALNLAWCVLCVCACL